MECLVSALPFVIAVLIIQCGYIITKTTRRLKLLDHEFNNTLVTSTYEIYELSVNNFTLLLQLLEFIVLICCLSESQLDFLRAFRFLGCSWIHCESDVKTKKNYKKIKDTAREEEDIQKRKDVKIKKYQLPEKQEEEAGEEEVAAGEDVQKRIKESWKLHILKRLVMFILLGILSVLIASITATGICL